MSEAYSVPVIAFFGNEAPLKCFPLKILIFKCEILKEKHKIVHTSILWHRHFLEQKTTK